MMSGNRVLGYGCAAALAVIAIVALVMTLLVSNIGGSKRHYEDVPEEIPPQAPAELPDIDTSTPGRTADKLTYWSDGLSEETGVDGQALRAYGNAELIARKAWPECHLRWNTLAGIGWVETKHGTYTGKPLRGARLNDEGISEPKIIGIPLDGSNSTNEIPDTDGGKLDGDTEHDRAVGPMQFIPGSWEHFGLDANGDGVADPHQIDDAALSSAKLLCSSDRDLSTPEDWEDAVLSYNSSVDYLRRVAAAANAYAVGQPAQS